jgi:hypothetical protein
LAGAAWAGAGFAVVSSRCTPGLGLDSDRFEAGEAGSLDLLEQARHVHSSMGGRVGREPPRRLLELPLAADAVFPSGLVPGHGDVNEPLKEIALLELRGAPRLFEDLVRRKVLAAADQVETVVEPRSRP